MKRNAASVMVLVALGAALVGGIIYSSRADRAAGNGYAAYSSLRTDPRGSKVLFEALGRTSGLTVDRNFRDIGQLREKGSSILMIGISPGAMVYEPDSYFEELERAAQGNRLMIALEPATKLGPPVPKKAQALDKRWGIHLKDGGFGISQEWKTLLAAKGTPVIVERTFGAADIVLAADADIFTNEAMADDRQPALIAMLIGPNTRVVFDESHLGILETGSVAGLARKYRLQGLLWGLALLAAVFLWKAATEFPPPAPDYAAAVKGRDAGEGFLRLLQRNLAPEGLMRECLREWRRTAPRDSRFATMEHAASEERDPLRAYQRIQRELGKI